jgi:hypothetical protein
MAYIFEDFFSLSQKIKQTREKNKTLLGASLRSIFGSRKKNIEIKKQQLQNLIISVYQHSAMFFLSSVTSVLQKKRNVSRFPKLKKSFKTMK